MMLIMVKLIITYVFIFLDKSIKNENGFLITKAIYK